MTYWRTIDFRPAPPGWRFYWLGDTAEPVWTEAVVGWAVQEETPSIEDYADENVPAGDRRRRIVPVHYVDVPPYLEDVDDSDSNLWMILGPGEEEPSADDKARAARGYAERQAAAEARRLRKTP